MLTAFEIFAKPAKQPVAKKPAAKTPAVKRGSKRTEEFLAAIVGLRFK